VKQITSSGHLILTRSFGDGALTAAGFTSDLFAILNTISIAALRQLASSPYRNIAANSSEIAKHST
jgi:hypothetical protein